MQCPTMRFATSTLSHLMFLILLLLVTFHFEDEYRTIYLHPNSL